MVKIASGTAQLNYDIPKFHRCSHVERSFEELKSNGSFLSREEIVKVYAPAGFRHFKLDGRSFGREKLVDSMIYYFVKPEFADKMKGIIYKEIYEAFEEMKKN